MFSVNKEKPGIVTVREYSDSSSSNIKIFKTGVTKKTITGSQTHFIPPGLDLDRQWYLYEQIRMHCKSTLAGDITCPKPSVPKDDKTTSTAPGTSASTVPGDVSSRKRLCIVGVNILDTQRELVLISKLHFNVHTVFFLIVCSCFG